MYRLVSKSKYRPVRVELEGIIHEVQKIMKKEYGYSFQYQLIGSGKNHLITTIEKGNEGFDFDYNFIIAPPREGYHYKADVVKQQFMQAVKKALVGTKYTDPKDRTSVITIKVVDKKNSRILHSCDFAIIYYDHSQIKNGYLYLKHLKKENTYTFEYRSSSDNIKQRLARIKQNGRGWKMVQDEYLTLKNINKDEDKSSSSLYLEAVNNVYNSMFSRSK